MRAARCALILCVRQFDSPSCGCVVTQCSQQRSRAHTVVLVEAMNLVVHPGNIDAIAKSRVPVVEGCRPHLPHPKSRWLQRLQTGTGQASAAAEGRGPGTRPRSTMRAGRPHSPAAVHILARCARETHLQVSRRHGGARGGLHGAARVEDHLHGAAGGGGQNGKRGAHDTAQCPGRDQAMGCPSKPTLPLQPSSLGACLRWLGCCASQPSRSVRRDCTGGRLRPLA